MTPPFPTVFLRDPQSQRVVPEVRPGCEWVVRGEGSATRMYDGIGLFYGALPNNLPTVPAGCTWWRWEAKDGGRVLVPATELWERITVAVGNAVIIRVGTYELCGPGINGNPEGFESAVIIHHDSLPELPNVPRTYDTLSDFMRTWPHEGIVWHHDDGRRVKLRRTDFGQ